jgi:predicted O-methyltransferase YrrM
MPISLPRQFYTRFLRGTPLGNGIRNSWFGAKHALEAPFDIYRTPLGRPLAIARRAGYVARYYHRRIKPAGRWLFASQEMANFTYDLTDRNKRYLANMVAVATERDAAEIADYMAELDSDRNLKDFIAEKIASLGPRSGIDAAVHFGRRLGWYAVVRASKPRVVVETGVDKGLGSIVLCAALLRNAADGHPGRYYGTDINPAAGFLLDGPYRGVGEILYGDSLQSLAAMSPPIDVFINDSDHSEEYEAREYRCVEPKLSRHAVVLGDNAHVTDELARFSLETGRQFIFFREEPKDHWYLGAGIGISFRRHPPPSP